MTSFSAACSVSLRQGPCIRTTHWATYASPPASCKRQRCRCCGESRKPSAGSGTRRVVMSISPAAQVRALGGRLLDALENPRHVHLHIAELAVSDSSLVIAVPAVLGAIAVV